MANVKKISVAYTETGITVYCIIRREADDYLLNDADGNFADPSGPVADPYVLMTENSIIKGLYELSESRQEWDDGKYIVMAYKQTGESSAGPDPSNDQIIGQTSDDALYIANDTEVSVNEYAANSAFQNGKIWIDADNGSSGTAYPIGRSSLNSVDNWPDALSISVANGNIGVFDVRGAITIGAGDDISGMVFQEGGDHAMVTLTSGCTTLNTVFRDHIHITGTFGGHVHCHNCHLLENTFLLEGFYEDCLFDDGNYSVATALTRFINSKSSGQQGQAVTLSTTGVGVDLGIWGWSGKLELTDKDNGETFDIDGISAEIEIASSCMDGRINIRGLNVDITDNSGAGCNVVTDKVLSELVRRTLGLVHENVYYDNPTYDVNNNLQTFRLRIYSDKASVGTDSDVIDTYNMTAVNSAPGRFTTWKMVKS